MQVAGTLRRCHQMSIGSASCGTSRRVPQLELPTDIPYTLNQYNAKLDLPPQ
jgi:hypothetical protein